MFNEIEFVPKIEFVKRSFRPITKERADSVRPLIFTTKSIWLSLFKSPVLMTLGLPPAGMLVRTEKFPSPLLIQTVRFELEVSVVTKSSAPSSLKSPALMRSTRVLFVMRRRPK